MYFQFEHRENKALGNITKKVKECSNKEILPNSTIGTKHNDDCL
jgi:hypothetical protein